MKRTAGKKPVRRVLKRGALAKGVSQKATRKNLTKEKQSEKSEAHAVDPRASRNDLITTYAPFVRNVAKKLSARMNLPSTLLDEFVSAGYMGLVEAAERYKPEQGKEFRSYAYLRIRGAIIDYIRGCSDISSAAYRYAKAFKAAQEIREEQLERERVNGKARTGNERLSHILDYTARSVMAFRLSVVDVEEEATESLPTENPEEELIGSEEYQLLKEKVAELPEKEREVIEQYYFKDKSFSEILDDHQEISKSWLSRLHSRGLELLKDRIIKEEREYEAQMSLQ